MRSDMTFARLNGPSVYNTVLGKQQGFLRKCALRRALQKYGVERSVAHAFLRLGNRNF